MDALPEGIESRFQYVLLVSKRAEQLIQGVAPRVQRKGKLTTTARTEVDRSLVQWSTTPPEPDMPLLPEEE